MRTTAPSLAVGLVAALALAGCAAETAPAPSCQEVLAQASYETMRQLAAAGVAADPEALREALPGDPAPRANDAVELPAYAVLTGQFDDAERAELLSALASRSTGVGEYFDEQAFFESTSRDGACAGWLHADE